MRTIQFTDGQLTTLAIKYEDQQAADIEIQLPGDGAMAPRHSLGIVEAESLINLLRQAVAQAREFERSAPVGED
jgi:hypothetical protein